MIYKGRVDLKRTSKCFAILVAIFLMGCSNREVTYTVNNQICPETSLVTVGVIESYKILLEIKGRNTVVLVPNIDLPSDVHQYINYMKSSEDGIDIGVSDSSYVNDIDIQVGKQCRIRTIKPTTFATNKG